MEWFYDHYEFFLEGLMVQIEVFWLIWLLRSQGKAVKQRNNGFGGLGIEFYDLICGSLRGQLTARKVYANWANFGIKWPVGNFALPETSARYLIPVNQIPILFSFISRHP
jgi:hypothetical protein